MFGVLFSAPASTQTLVTPCHKACDIMRSFRYLGYKTTWERVEHVSREVDNDSSGYISFQDGLQLVFADFSCYPARRLLIWLDWLNIINWSFDLWICFYLDLFRGVEVLLDFCSNQYLAGAVEIDPPHPRCGTGGHRIHLRSFGRRWHEVPSEATWHVFIRVKQLILLFSPWKPFCFQGYIWRIWHMLVPNWSHSSSAVLFTPFAWGLTKALLRSSWYMQQALLD